MTSRSVRSITAGGQQDREDEAVIVLALVPVHAEPDVALLHLLADEGRSQGRAGQPEDLR